MDFMKLSSITEPLRKYSERVVLGAVELVIDAASWGKAKKSLRS